jgi:hypothetical protein
LELFCKSYKKKKTEKEKGKNKEKVKKGRGHQTGPRPDLAHGPSSRAQRGISFSSFAR